MNCDLADIKIPELTFPEMCWSRVEQYKDNTALVRNICYLHCNMNPVKGEVSDSELNAGGGGGRGGRFDTTMEINEGTP